MADQNAENADVDEMRRKARRRLVGAVVLALAAAVLLPLLLEKEPRPLGDDVSVQIPPVDDGKFVNRLTGKGSEPKPVGKIEAKAISKAPSGADGAAESPSPKTMPTSPTGGEASAPQKSAETEKSSAPAKESAVKSSQEGGVRPASKVGVAAPTATSVAASDAASPKSATGDTNSIPTVIAANTTGAKSDASGANPASKSTLDAIGASPAVKSTSASTSAPTKSPSAEKSPSAKAASPEGNGTNASAAEKSASSTAKPTGFAVQLAAYADEKGANTLANKLKKVGYASYVETVETSRGTLWRVRVGGYETKAEAEAAQLKLKSEGFSGIVAIAK